MTVTLLFHRESKGPYTFAYLCNEDAPNLSNPPNKGRLSCDKTQGAVWLQICMHST